MLRSLSRTKQMNFRLSARYRQSEIGERLTEYALTNDCALSVPVNIKKPISLKTFRHRLNGLKKTPTIN